MCKLIKDITRAKNVHGTFQFIDNICTFKDTPKAFGDFKNKSKSV